MTDIYHAILNQDMKKLSTEKLSELADIYSDAAFSVTAALTTIGNLALDACENPDYIDEDARRDVRHMGAVLRNLPRMLQALEQNARQADHLLRDRQGESK